MDSLVQQANSLLASGHYRDAVERYLHVAKEWPSKKPTIRDHLMVAVSQLMDQLNLKESCKSPQKSEDYEIFTWLVRSMYSLYGNDPSALTMMGVKCLDEGMYEQAEVLLKATIQAHPESLGAKENLRVLFDRVVNRWHFHMLNDFQRNSSYFRTIHSALRSMPDCSVLDIGSGTGILSMMAVRAGSKRVYACEINKKMVDISHDILSANGMEDQVTVLHSLSTALSVPKDIPKKVSLVVTETVDAGLLGECIIPTLRHAWKHLLLPPQPKDETANQSSEFGHVIPCGATVHAVAIESSEIRKQSKLLQSPESIGLSLDGVRIEGSCKNSEGGYQLGQGISELTVEPYTCERLRQIRGGYRLLTHSAVVLHFDFTNPEIPLPDSHTPLQVTENGQLDAIAVWFDVHLDKHTSFSTAPSWDISWEQAVFPVREDINLQRGDVVHLHASCSDTLLSMVATNVERDGRANEEGVCVGDMEQEGASQNGDTGLNSVSNGLEQTLMEVGEVEQKMSNGWCSTALAAPKRHKVFYVERSDLARLNDANYIGCYKKALSEAIAAAKCLDSEEEGGGSELESSSSSGSESEGDCLVLDMTRGLSLFGLISAKEGADFVQTARSHEAYKGLVKHLAEVNQIEDKFSFQNLDLTKPPLSQSPPIMWDILVCDLVNPQGVLRSGVMEELVCARSRYFHSSSIILPSSFTVHAAVISSPSLRAQSSVLGAIPTLGFNIARFVNQYQVTHYTDVDLCTFPHQTLTGSFELMHINLNGTHTKTFHTVDREVTVSVTSDGTAVGVAYWFTLQLYGNITMTTGPEQNSHWHQSVFLLPEDVELISGQEVKVQAAMRDSCMDITMINAESEYVISYM